MSNNSIKSRIIELFPDIGEMINEMFDFNKLEMYLKFLKEFNVVGGFFSKADSENILDRHVIESIFHIYKIIEAYPVSYETKLADIGAGPGLPGYVFYALKNTPMVTLVDSQKRRLGILEKFHTQEFSDTRVKFLYQRVEDVNECFNLVVMRSTVKYPWSAEVIIRLLQNNSYFVPFLGRRNYDLSFEKRLLGNLGLKIEKEIDITELEFLGNRHIKLLKKIDESKNGYPRTWETISKEIKRTSWEK